MKPCKNFWIGIFLIAALGLAGCLHLVTKKEGGADRSQRERGGYGY